MGPRFGLDGPACSELLYQLGYPGPLKKIVKRIICNFKDVETELYRAHVNCRWLLSDLKSFKVKFFMILMQYCYVLN